ncbi:hypothetical protein PIB30_031123 [Stylosanthes scabra]|uniref:Uncharacterized protein n=1 Tax=Stylosanthes scabra TaxID=79078 RepID=A0ABU6WA95_9FABA|nr:hypothetical protein [Stylosanthes scabra]
MLSPTKKNEKKEKNKEKFGNRGNGAAARPEIAKTLHHRSHCAPAPSSWRVRTSRALSRWPWRACAVSLATFGRSYQVAWRVRALFLARPHGRAMAFVRPRPSTCCSRTSYWKDRAPAPLWPRARVSPFVHILGPHLRARPRDRHGAPARRPLLLKTVRPSLSFILLPFSLLSTKSSQLRISHTHTPPLLHCFSV